MRRATAILALMTDESVTTVAKQGAAARSTVYRWVGRYQTAGIDGLRVSQRGRSHWTVTDELVDKLLSLLKETPQALGYLRST
ncbi:MAG: helix-turn-helix domain-containing protein [Gammaproteobacteria bacterium]|nr:helix-turn-helix domain-containing protein [Gammaproteobacteria bacterium]